MTDKIKQLISLVVPYTFFAAACWHLPYWSTFDINPFEYMGINDIIMSFIYPLVFSILSFIVPSFYSYFYTWWHELSDENKNEEKQKELPKETKWIRFWDKVFDFIEAYFHLNNLKIILIIIVGLVSIWASPDGKWIYIPILFFFIFWIQLAQSKLVADYLPKKYKKTVIFFALVILCYSVINSKVRGVRIRDARCYDYTIDTSISNERLKVLGKLGDYMILTTVNNDTKYIVPLGNKNAFEIKTFETKKE